MCSEISSDRVVMIKLSRKILVAPVGWYENRLLKSIVTIRPDKVYLIMAKEGKFREVTEHYLNSMKKKLSVFQDLNVFSIDESETADFHDVTDVYRCFVRIIEKERLEEKPAEIILDVTSTTKDGALAASLVGQLYDITISYVPSKEKYEWQDLQLKEILKNLKSGAEDPGNECLQYKIKFSPLDEKPRIALRKAYDYPSSSIGKLTEEILKESGKEKTKATFRRYWGRIYHKLEEDQLVEIRKRNKKTEVVLTPIGKALVEGILKGREEEKESQERLTGQSIAR